jgi:hypothetical protein
MKLSIDRIKRPLAGAVAALLACLLFGTISQARGDTVPEASTVIAYSLGSSPGPVIITSDTSATYPSLSSGTMSGMDGSNQFSVTGWSSVGLNSAGILVLGATSALTVSGPGPITTLGDSSAIFTDYVTLTPTAADPLGTTALFTPTATISGNYSSTTGTANFSYIIVNAGYGAAGSIAGAQADLGIQGNSVIGSTICMPVPPPRTGCTLSFAPLTVAYGVPFELVQYLDAYVYATPGPGGATEEGSSNFGDTAQITSIAVDVDGSPVSSFSATSASGLDYTANGVFATPEPSGLSLLGVGLLFLALMVKRRHTNFFRT